MLYYLYGKLEVNVIEKSYKFRIYPNKQQQEMISKTFGCCRFVYNHYLEERKTAWEIEKRRMSGFDCIRDLTQLKKREESSFLNEITNIAMQQSLRDLDRAYANFFRGIRKGQGVGYPKFKSKHGRQSYRVCGHGVHLCANHVQLPKIGLVKCRVSKEVKGRVLSITVIRNPSGKYFISVCCTCGAEKHLPKTGKSVGIDLGSHDIAVLSNGIKYENPRFLYKSSRKIKRLQRQLSRKQNGSNNRKKAKIKLANAHERVANQRLDYVHKMITDIVRNYDSICIEDLDVKEMQKNHYAAKATIEVSFYEIRRQLEYKCAWYGKQLHIIDRYFPSSQLCSVCGYKNEDVKDLAVRDWVCPNCGTYQDRDVNAAVNILREGLTMAG